MRSAPSPLRTLALLLAAATTSPGRAEPPPRPELERPERAEPPPSDDAAQQDSQQAEAHAGLSPSVLDDALAMATPAQEPAPRHIVYPRFSDGPRAVPRARGASLVRAQALGIGGHATTRQMLWSRPAPELLAAVPGKAPKSLLWPVVGGCFGRGFGYTRKLRPELRHNGVDIGAPEGAAVRAVAEGLVVYSDNTLSGFGNAVMILHPGGLTTLYGHNQRNTVQPGYYVKRGERIAIVGHTGMAWGPHLHFELRDNGRWRDPEPLFAGKKDVELTGLLIDLTRVAPAKQDERLAPAHKGSSPRETRARAEAPAPSTRREPRAPRKALD
jgi:murein DD-endopeptidase MepM/ murein hydrolase activator NlpD